MQNIKETTKRVICPECKGNKTAAYLEETAEYSGFTWKTCCLCGGEGLVMKVKTVEYKPFGNAN